MRFHAIDTRRSMQNPISNSNKTLVDRAVEVVEKQDAKDFAVCFDHKIYRTVRAPGIRKALFGGGGGYLKDIFDWMSQRFLRESDELIVYTDLLEPFVFHLVRDLPYRIRFMLPIEHESTVSDEAAVRLNVGYYDYLVDIRSHEFTNINKHLFQQGIGQWDSKFTEKSSKV